MFVFTRFDFQNVLMGAKIIDISYFSKQIDNIS